MYLSHADYIGFEFMKEHFEPYKYKLIYNTPRNWLLAHMMVLQKETNMFRKMGVHLGVIV